MTPPTGYTITCDQAGCQATLTATRYHTLITSARAAGWLTGPGVDACPDHWNRVEPQP